MRNGSTRALLDISCINTRRRVIAGMRVSRTLEALEGRQMEDGQWRIRIETDGVAGWVQRLTHLLLLDGRQ